ncbi:MULTISPECIES: hypothetical protein [unclassified Mesorhizobium]|uniref:hypothetical protein n=1 Tax=unclassified Mesorhizobium TaxID=325217 RepID=UPI0016733C2C|nr:MULTISPECIES: hypothetical protein [unclassified Mesorhizobium]
MADKPATTYIVSVFEKPHWRTVLTTKDKAKAEAMAKRSAIRPDRRDHAEGEALTGQLSEVVAARANMRQQISFIDDPGLKESQRGRGQNLAVYRAAVPFSVGGYLVDHPLADRPIFRLQELALRCS